MQQQRKKIDQNHHNPPGIVVPDTTTTQQPQAITIKDDEYEQEQQKQENPQQQQDELPGRMRYNNEWILLSQDQFIDQKSLRYRRRHDILPSKTTTMKTTTTFITNRNHVRRKSQRNSRSSSSGTTTTTTIHTTIQRLIWIGIFFFFISTLLILLLFIHYDDHDHVYSQSNNTEKINHTTITTVDQQLKHVQEQRKQQTFVFHPWYDTFLGKWIQSNLYTITKQISFIDDFVIDKYSIRDDDLYYDDDKDNMKRIPIEQEEDHDHHLYQVPYSSTKRKKPYRRHSSSSSSQRDSLTIFYNIYIPFHTNDKDPSIVNAIQIIQEQLRQIVNSPALKYPTILYYNIIGNYQPLFQLYNITRSTNGSSSTNNLCAIYGNTNLQCILLNTYKEGSETITLQNLYDYCHKQDITTNRTIKSQYQQVRQHRRVTYLHSKGSYHINFKNTHWRRALTDAALSEGCVHPPRTRTTTTTETISTTTCNVCGLQFYIQPTFYIPGNMFTASCQYINELLPPQSNVYQTKREEIVIILLLMQVRNLLKSTLFGSDNNNRKDYYGLDRYNDEHWIGSHPSIRPCDMDIDGNIVKVFFGQTTVRSEHSIYNTGVPNTIVGINTWNLQKQIQLSTIQSLRERDVLLLPGYLLKWYVMYQQTPPSHSWVWDYFPDGLMWKQYIELYGMIGAFYKVTNKYRISLDGSTNQPPFPPHHHQQVQSLSLSSSAFPPVLRTTMKIENQKEIETNYKNSTFDTIFDEHNVLEYGGDSGSREHNNHTRDDGTKKQKQKGSTSSWIYSNRAIFYHIAIPDGYDKDSAIHIIPKQLQIIASSYAVTSTNDTDQKKTRFYYTIAGGMIRQTKNKRQHKRMTNKNSVLHYDNATTTRTTTFEQQNVIDENRQHIQNQLREFCTTYDTILSCQELFYLHPQTYNNKDNSSSSSPSFQQQQQQPFDYNYEGVTMEGMYQFCQRYPSSVVSYVHNQGPIQLRKKGNGNDHYIQHMTYAVTSQLCIESLLSNMLNGTAAPNTTTKTTCNVCGLVFYIFSSFMYPGNMFVTKCSYVQQLLSPLQFEQSLTKFIGQVLISKLRVKYQTYLYDNDVSKNTATGTEQSSSSSSSTNSMMESFGLDQYAIYHWIGSHPSIIPCDLSGVLSLSTQAVLERNNSSNNVFVPGQPNNVSIYQRTLTTASRHAIDYWKQKPFHSFPSTRHWNKHYQLDVTPTRLEDPYNNFQLHHYYNIIHNDSMCYREYFLLGGRMDQWITLYQQIPGQSSWIWSTMPHGNIWYNGYQMYHTNVVDILTKPYAIDGL